MYVDEPKALLARAFGMSESIPELEESLYDEIKFKTCLRKTGASDVTFKQVITENIVELFVGQTKKKASCVIY